MSRQPPLTQLTLTSAADHPRGDQTDANLATIYGSNKQEVVQQRVVSGILFLNICDSNLVFPLAPTRLDSFYKLYRWVVVPGTRYYFSRYYVAVPSKLSQEYCQVQVSDWTGSDDTE